MMEGARLSFFRRYLHSKQLNFMGLENNLSRVW